MQPSNTATLQARFRNFAREAKGRSPLYEHVSARLADCEAALALLARAPASQRRPNLLFAAVHDVLLAGAGHPLAGYYPSVTNLVATRAAPAIGHQTGSASLGSASLDEAHAAFIDLLETEVDAITTTMLTRRTQTNEVGRCAALWPAVQRVAAETPRPLTLVEIGSSAGLLLHLDRYDYGTGAASSSAPRIRATVRGKPPSPGGPDAVRVHARIGVDLEPLDVTEPTDARWLRACIWPEDLARMARLDAAIDVAIDNDDLDLRQADAVEALPELLNSLATDSMPVLFHSAAVAYLTADQRQAVAESIAVVGRTRDLAWLSLEGQFIEPFASRDAQLPCDRDEETFLLGLTRWTNGVRHDQLLARVQPHGAWIDWLSPSDGEIKGDR